MPRLVVDCRCSSDWLLGVCHLASSVFLLESFLAPATEAVSVFLLDDATTALLVDLVVSSVTSVDSFIPLFLASPAFSLDDATGMLVIEMLLMVVSSL